MRNHFVIENQRIGDFLSKNKQKMGLKRSNNFQFVLIYMALLLEYCSTLGDNYIRIMRNTRLKGEYTYLTLERWTIAYCLIECSNDKAECASINYNQVEQICELNRFVELNGEKSGEGKLKSQPGWTFYQKDSNVRFESKYFFLVSF